MEHWLFLVEFRIVDFSVLSLKRYVVLEMLHQHHNKIAKDVFEQMCAKVGMHYAVTTGIGDPQRDPRHGDDLADQIIAKQGLKQLSDSGEIEKVVDQVLAANAHQVADFRAGKEKAFNALVGQVMKASQGKANPAQVNAILKHKLR